MTYYIMYEDNIDYENIIVECASAGAVEKFIETKINDQGYSPKDFKIVKGAELPTEVVPKRARVILKTETP